MKLRTALFVLLAISLIVGDADAGWKFWKKKDKETTTAAPEVTTPAAAPVKPAAGKPATTSTTANTNIALAGAADPGLAIGVGNTGGNIRNNAQTHKPNPGTEVGLDISAPRPKPGAGGNNGGGYRDWAADLTGAGERGRQPPKLPSEGPALTVGGATPSPASRPGTPSGNTPGQPGQQQPSTGSRPGTPTGGQPQAGQQQPSPGSRPGTPTGGQPQAGQQQPSPGSRPGTPTGGQPQAGQQQPSPGSRPGTPTGGQPQAGQQQPSPGSRPGTPTGGQPQAGQQQPGYPALGQPGQTPRPGMGVAPGTQGGSNDGKPQVSTLNIGSLNPGSRPGSASGSRPGSPGSPTGTGGMTWANVAAGGNKPGSPTPAPRPGQGGQGGNIAPGQSRPGTVPVQPYGQPGHQGAQGGPGLSTGGAIATGAVGGAIGGAVANKVFSSNPTYSKGKTITDEDLQKLSEALFIKDVNNANKYITLNLQKRTSGSSPTDEAPQPLLTVKPEALQIPTIQKVLALYDNYEKDARTNEYVSPAERQEESVLVDTFLSTNVMSAAMRFLADKDLIRKDYYEYKDALRRIWFNLYSRGEGKIGSSGFEHVFLSETKLGTEVLGQHNWIYFNSEEVNRRANYLGYVKKVDLGDKASIIKIHATYNGIDKPVSTLFVGTSPELEMALYTVCFFARSEKPCPVSLGGTQFNIITHKFRYRGKDLVGSAYPEI